MSNVQSFELEKPKKFNFVRDVLDRNAKECADLSALYWVASDGHKEITTFKEMSVASQKAANVLKSHGLKRGDVVILVIGKLPVWWTLFSACLRLGIVISPAPTSISARDLDYRIEAAGAKGLVVQEDLISRYAESEKLKSLTVKFSVAGEEVVGWTAFEPQYEKAPEDCPAEDTDSDEEALCYFTSGTTGYPKMTVHTHASYGIGHEITGKFWLNLSEGDINWSMSDTGWAKAAWGCYFAPWRQKAAIFIAEMPKFNVDETLALLEAHPIHTFCAPPTIYRLLIQENIDVEKISHLKHCVSAGEPLNPEAMNAWIEATGLKIYEGYGQTETVALCGTQTHMEVKPGSMGKAMPGFTVEVVDADGVPVEPGVEGNIAVKVKPERPIGLFREYKNNPEKTAETHQGDWYLTGDKAYKDDDGYLWFLSRSDDVIISSGYRIGPFEVESAIQEHPAVLECAVVSSPDKTRGEVVKAFIILTGNHYPSDELIKDIQNHVKNVTAPYKYPRKIEFVTELPKTISGKIRRVELREREWRKSS